METMADFRVNIRIKWVYRQCQDILKAITMIMRPARRDHDIILAHQQTIEI